MPNQATKQLVEISDIQDVMVFLKNGSLRAIMEVSAINFDLRSEQEQAAILQGFQSFLDSLDFPLQIVVSSRKFDIDDYLKTVEEATAPLTNELLKIQAAEYMKFVKELADLANIMSKKFYIVIPFYVVEAPSGKGILDGIKGIFKPAKTAAVLSPEQLATYKNQLLQRVDLVSGGLVGLGLHTKLLERDESIDLFYGLYNPGTKTKITHGES